MQNHLYTCDNIYLLNGMNSESVDLIYLDPPFNSKRTYSAPVGSKSAGASFKDMWVWDDVNTAYLEQLYSKHPTIVDFINTIYELHSKAMGAYITYMTQRLIEMHRVLKPTGSVYLHIDPTASHYLKIIMDGIFGKANFRNEIIWQRNDGRAKGSQFSYKKYGANTDTLLFYTKSNDYYLNINAEFINDEGIHHKFNKIDSNNRSYYTGIPVFRSKTMGDRPNLCFEWRGFKNPHPAGWRLSKERLEEEYQKGNIIIKNNGTLERRKYLDDYQGKPLDNNWIDIPRAGGKERTGYPTQKPLALLRRIIEASSNAGDVVFDPFCGCATAMVSAQQLQRKWIGCDIEEKAVDILVDRLKDDVGMFKDFVHTTTPPVRTDIEKAQPTPLIKDRLYQEQEGHCNGCYDKMEKRNLEIDHIIPKSKGGGDYYENYQLLCGHCNRTKGNRTMDYLNAKVNKIKENRVNISYG